MLRSHAGNGQGETLIKDQAMTVGFASVLLEIRYDGLGADVPKCLRDVCQSKSSW